MLLVPNVQVASVIYTYLFSRAKPLMLHFDKEVL